MSQCNVEFFNTKLEHVYHDEIELEDVDLDYLTPEASSFDISQPNNVAVRNLVRFSGLNNFVGVVDSVQQDEDFTTVSVKPFLMLFDQSILFDTNWQYAVDHFQLTQDEDVYKNSAGTRIRSYYEYNYDDDVFNLISQLPDGASSWDNVHPVRRHWYVYMLGDRTDSEGYTYSWTKDTEVKQSHTYYAVNDYADRANPIFERVTATGNPRRKMLYEKSKVYKKPLENRIKEIIQRYYDDPYDMDEEQKIPIEFELTSETRNWTFDIVPDEDNDPDNHHAIVEFYDTVLQNALMSYRVTVESEFDFANKAIKLTIGVPNTEETKTTFEANLPGIGITDFTVGKMESDINKLEIWNNEAYDKTVWDEENQKWVYKKESSGASVINKKHVLYYYLKDNGDITDDKSNDKRIYPIKMEVISCGPEREFNQVDEEDTSTGEGEDKQPKPGVNPKDNGWWEQSPSGSGYCRTRDTEVKTVTSKDDKGCETESVKPYFTSVITKPFSLVALEQAREKFANVRWQNHVELEMLPSLFDAASMRVGSLTDIYYNGKMYSTILTGKKIGSTVTLIFGTIRVDYTKRTQLGNSVLFTKVKNVSKKSKTSST